MPPPNTFFQFFWGMGRAFFFQTKFLDVASSLGHLSMKKNFSDRTNRLCSKLRQKKGAAGWQPPPWTFFNLFFNYEDYIQS